MTDRHCASCNADALEERPAAWTTRRDVVCANCGAGGYVTRDGIHRGPAYESLPQTNRGQRLN